MAAQQVLPHMVHRYDCLSLRIAVVLCVLTPPPACLSSSSSSTVPITLCIFFSNAFFSLLFRSRLYSLVSSIFISIMSCGHASIPVCALVRACLCECQLYSNNNSSSNSEWGKRNRISTFLKFQWRFITVTNVSHRYARLFSPLPPLSVSHPLSLHVCVSVLRSFLVVAPRKNRWCDDQNKSQKQQQQQHPQVNGDRYFSLSL